jgi:predicted nucleic acid-binding protein
MLPRLFDEIVIPPAVLQEAQSNKSALPPVPLAKHPWLRVQAPRNSEQVKQLRKELDGGEAEAIALALELKAEILMDESDGRAVARRLGLVRVGALGVLLRLKRRGLINEVLPQVDRLQRELNFFISSQLRAEIKRLARE